MGYYNDNRVCEFSDLKGLVLDKVEYNKGSDQYRDDEIVFHVQDGRKFRLTYYPDCCADCSVESIDGDLNDLTNTPILMTEEVSNHENPPDRPVPEYQDSFTWTFYKLGTVNGYVTIRWYGSSNGYYSESATFEEVKESN